MKKKKSIKYITWTKNNNECYTISSTTIKEKVLNQLHVTCSKLIIPILY